MTYIIISDIAVQAANAMACNFVINSAPIFAVTMFAHALQRKTKLPIARVAMNHLNACLLAESSAPFFTGAYQPQQRRGATFINKTDYAGLGTTPATSFQPTVTQHLLLTLVLETDTPQHEIPTAAISAFLRRGKLAGGTITDHGQIVICASQDDVRMSCRTGFWLVARPDLLSFGPDMLKQFIGNATSRSESWITPLVFGYAAITGLGHRNNVRLLMNAENSSDFEIPLHAFAEPLVGLGQFIAVNQYTGTRLPFWKQSLPRQDVWLVEQSI
jgi:CRISPR-associated protein Csy2